MRALLRFAEEEAKHIQERACRSRMSLSGMTHPNFDKTLRELSAKGHERVGQLARAIA